MSSISSTLFCHPNNFYLFIETFSSFQAGYSYRHTVCKTIPHLKILDDIPTGREIRPGTASNFENDWSFLQELANDGTIGSIESMEEVETGQCTIYGKCDSKMFS